MTPEFALALVPRLHEEIAQLRRDLTWLEELIVDIEEAVELPDSCALRVESYFEERKPDMTPADSSQLLISNRDFGDEDPSA